MGLIKALVTKVQRNPKNKEGAIVSLNNGETLWLQIAYITAILEGAFMEDCRPTALTGSEVTYELKAHAVGDLVFDRKGQVKVGETVKYSTAGKRPINLLVGEVAGFINDFDKARMNATAFAKAMAGAASAFAPRAAAAVEQQEAPAPAPAAPAAKKKAKVLVEDDEDSDSL